MKYAHHIIITALARPEEDSEHIKTGLRLLVPFPLEEQKITLETQKLLTSDDRRMYKYTIDLSKERHTTAFLRFLLETLSEEQKELLLSQAENRLDEEYNFFIRIDKDKWKDEHLLWLTDSGQCYHLKIVLATYPKQHDTALTLVKTILTKKDI